MNSAAPDVRPRIGGYPPGSGLLASCLRGDQGAWESLVRSHAGLVYTVIRRCGFDGDDAADVFQDIWLAAWDGLGSVRDERGLAAWLATIAARQAKRALGRRVRKRTTALDEAVEQPATEPLPDQVAIDRERSSVVGAAVAELPSRDRRIVEYFFYDSTAPSYIEIAERLGVNPSTVGPLRTRCLRRLRVALEGSAALADADID